MPDYSKWKDRISESYVNYLKTAFYFRDKALRESFREALGAEGELVRGPFSEPAFNFKTGARGTEIADKLFLGRSDDLAPALWDSPLYAHQEKAIQSAFVKEKNIVVATGAASGKTECFLYPILFDLYRQHLSGNLRQPGVRAMIIYPMNALANDQQERLGRLGAALKEAGSGFGFTFGQYTGQTPENIKDNRRGGFDKAGRRRPGELVFRDEMRANQPHILMTNYSMLEYLLLRPNDSRLFENGRHWRFIVLDEAHLHRGARGAEIGMLMRRLKRRVREGGRAGGFTCVATSATITSHRSNAARGEAADFAKTLFGEEFLSDSVRFSETSEIKGDGGARREHVFARALEGAFLVHEKGTDKIALNRKSEIEGCAAIEVALCRECGQRYYIGRERDGYLGEPVRDPSRDDFGGTYFIPSADADGEATHILCRVCAALRPKDEQAFCECGADIRIKECASNQPDHPDQIKKCEFCGYMRGGHRDPVQEIVHGADGPGAVFVTALHRLLPENRRKVLSFADNRQEAAFFAWFAEDSYRKIADRNSILRALKSSPIESGGVSASDLSGRLLGYWESERVKFKNSDTQESRANRAVASVWKEALSDERRLSLMGVGLVKWSVHIPDEYEPPDVMLRAPWGFSRNEAMDLIRYLLMRMVQRGAISAPGAPVMSWKGISPGRAQMSYVVGDNGKSRNVIKWDGPGSAAALFIKRLGGVDSDQVVNLLRIIWRSLMGLKERVLQRVDNKNSFRLNPALLRVSLPAADETWICGDCANICFINVRGACPRWQCNGELRLADQGALAENHYRILYESDDLPLTFSAEEHTAQIETGEAKVRQDAFKNGAVNLLSSSTTFEVGVDLGDLDAVFLRNVPPEAFNYVQRVGRAGRREGSPGFALTYCRRNSHDLYYYEDPRDRLIKGRTRSPLTHVDNVKIVLRHMTATVLGAFFKQPGNGERFVNMAALIGEKGADALANDLLLFCRGRAELRAALLEIAPDEVIGDVGLLNDSWAEIIVGKGSRLHDSVSGLLADLSELEGIEKRMVAERDYEGAAKIKGRADTLLDERVLDFMSRKAILPKHGFPVDVVELDILGGSYDRVGRKIELHRDLSMAIAEYAPGSRVIANKLQWESAGMRVMAGKEPRVMGYSYGEDGSFDQWLWQDKDSAGRGKKYVTPEWGFITEINYEPSEPQRKPERLYTARPFFGGFEDGDEPSSREMRGVKVTAAAPGRLLILSEGRKKNGWGFSVCLTCGRHSTKKLRTHRTPYNTPCKAKMGRYSYGYELVTDVTRLTFSGLATPAEGYSLGYALILGAAEAMGAPDTDLNMALARATHASPGFLTLFR